MPINIGVLALQGDYHAHAKLLARLDANVHFITTPQQLQTIDGLIIPGGESTTLLKLMEKTDFFDQLKHFHQQQKPLFGTCAGMILLATTVLPEQASLGLIDISVKRNAYGRQQDSFVSEQNTTISNKPIEMVFIRAPQVIDYGSGVDVLAQHQKQAILLQQKKVLAASFHPELGNNTCIHQHFINMITA